MLRVQQLEQTRGDLTIQTTLVVDGPFRALKAVASFLNSPAPVDRYAGKNALGLALIEDHRGGWSWLVIDTGRQLQDSAILPARQCPRLPGRAQLLFELLALLRVEPWFIRLGSSRVNWSSTRVARRRRLPARSPLPPLTSSSCNCRRSNSSARLRPARRPPDLAPSPAGSAAILKLRQQFGDDREPALPLAGRATGQQRPPHPASGRTRPAPAPAILAGAHQGAVLRIQTHHQLLRLQTGGLPRPVAAAPGWRVPDPALHWRHTRKAAAIHAADARNLARSDSAPAAHRQGLAVNSVLAFSITTEKGWEPAPPA